MRAMQTLRLLRDRQTGRLVARTGASKDAWREDTGRSGILLRNFNSGFRVNSHPR